MSEPTLRSRLTNLWTVVAIVGMAYPCSMIPTAWLIDQRLLSASTIHGLERFYYPLSYLYSSCPVIRELASYCV